MIAAEIDSEQLLIAHLLDQSDLTDLVGAEIHTERGGTDPQVVLFRIGGRSKTEEQIDEPIFQVEAWAEKGGRRTAKEITAVLRSALGFTRLGGMHGLGVVTDSREARGPLFAPDPVTHLPRFTFDIQLTVTPGGVFLS